jgi:hypothetical protein
VTDRMPLPARLFRFIASRPGRTATDREIFGAFPGVPQATITRALRDLAGNDAVTPAKAFTEFTALSEPPYTAARKPPWG